MDVQRSTGRGSAKRPATATSSKEETAERRNLRNKADIEGRGAATATKDDRLQQPPRVIEAAEVMKSKPTRLPDIVLEGPHEAALEFHEDWTIVPGSNRDPEKWELELRLRYSRNRLTREFLTEGRSVFHKSSEHKVIESSGGRRRRATATTDRRRGR